MSGSNDLDPSAPIASWTPVEEWLRLAVLYDALEVSPAPDFTRAERIVLSRARHSEAALRGPIPPEHSSSDGFWVRLAPVDHGHPWRRRWSARVWVAGHRDEAVSLSRDQPSARLQSGGGSLCVHPAVISEAAPGRPPPSCEPVPLSDLACGRHTRQSSAALDIGTAQAVGAWMAPTRGEASPWWELDLGASHYVQAIEIQCKQPAAGEVVVSFYAYHRPDGEPTASWRRELRAQPGWQAVELGQVGRYLRVEAQHCALEIAGLAIQGAPLSSGGLVESVRRTFSLFADRPLCSQRQLTKGELSGYEQWSSYRQVWERAITVGAGIDLLVEQPAERCFIGICASGREDWLVADLACIQRGHVVVPLAPTDSFDRLRHIVEECQLRAVFCSPDLAATFADLMDSSASLGLVIEMTPVAGERPSQLASHTIDEIEALGAKDVAELVSRPDDLLYTVLYTSGSTGQPKGAMRSYGAFSALVDSYGAAQPAVHLSFQPLSHLSERMMIPTVMRHGGQIGFASKDPARLFEDVALLRPTMFGGVPRVFDVLRSQYQAVFAQRRRAHPREDPETAAEIVHRKVRSLFGDRLQAVSIGSAKPSEAVLAFMRACFSDCWVSEGYGSTEVGTIAVDGTIIEGVDVDLVDVPELGYATSNDPPRGEIRVRTPHMISGYLGGRHTAVDEDGYFRTGDIGERSVDGAIRVIGRRSNVVKLAQGEFVSPERIEAALHQAAIVDQIYVHADSSRACVVAIVVPNRAALAEQLGVADAADDSWLRGAAAQGALDAAVREGGRRAGLSRFEIPAAAHVEPEPMTAANGLFTSSNKPDRRAIARRYGPALEALYTRAEPEPSALDVVEEVASALTANVDLEAPIERAGIDSLASVQLVMMLEERLQRRVSMEAWFASSSLQELAWHLDRGGRGRHDQARGDLELSLPFEHCTGPFSEPSLRQVLLTGATGFLGRGVLEWLLKRSEATVHCLVRAPSAVAGETRVREALTAAGASISAPEAERIRVVPGDLAAPELGLDARTWQALADTADTVIHAGAVVNWITHYDQLREANVLGTLALLELAAASRPSPFHYVSTISTAPATGDEKSALTVEQALGGSGYGLSKWIAERHATRAGDAGLPVAIHRPAMIAGHSRRGRGNPQDFVNRYLAGSAQLGCYLDLDEPLDMTPVDFVAEAIVALAGSPGAIGCTHHLVNIDQSMSYRRLGEAMRSAGAAVHPVSYAEFRQRLLEASRNGSPNPLIPLLSYFPAAGFALRMGPWPSSRTQRRLEALGVRCPAIGDEVIAAYLRWLGCHNFGAALPT